MLTKVHKAALVVLEKLTPRMQPVHSRSRDASPAPLAYVPGWHTVTGRHVRDPCVAAKVDPAMHDSHAVGLVCKLYGLAFPAAHAVHAAVLFTVL